MVEHLWTAAKHVTNIERPFHPVHQKSSFTGKQVFKKRFPDRWCSAGNVSLE